MNILASTQHVFLVGVKGVAMAGIARMLTQMGKKVSGGDTSEKQITDEIIANCKIEVVRLEDPLPQGVDLVLYSAAHGGAESAQVKEAQSKCVAIMHQAAFIAELIKQFPTSIAICGCHGKTGTSALLAYTLHELRAKVSWLVGAPYFKGLPNTSHSTSGTAISYPGGHFEKGSDIFVFEADEYGMSPPGDLTPKILLYYPTHILCTNIDFDHPDIYKDIHHVRKVFREFFTHASNVYECNSKSVQENRLGVEGVVHDLGFDPHQIETITKGFLGVARRLEVHGEHNGITFIDDYGHHPAEIQVTLAELRRLYPARRIVVAFQSHTYSRTYALKNQFVEALSKADVALIDAIFPSAREKPDAPRITAPDLEALAKAKGYPNIKGFIDRNDLVVYAKRILKKGDILLTLGAGDIYKIIDLFF